MLLNEALLRFIERPTRNLFFTGKGGVGKTSLACAAAIGLADRGRCVLLVSTDPASNLDEVLETTLMSHPTPMQRVANMFAMNLDPEQAARDYRERVVGPYRAVFPAATVASMEEQLSGACTVEIAAFDEFARLLGDPRTTAEFDHVVFDTAPTGHTLRLLSLPSAWTSFIQSNTTGTSCLGPLAGLGNQRELYATTVAALADVRTTTIVLVSRPDPAALKEAEACHRELVALGVGNQHLVINGVFTSTATDDPIAQALEKRGRESLESMPASLATLPRTTVRLAPYGLVGINALRELGRRHVALLPHVNGPAESSVLSRMPLPLESLLEELTANGCGIIVVAGKGGVGKTTVASAIAVELACRGHRVHLTTTDPAAHVEGTVNAVLSGLQVSRIDPHVESARYTQEVLTTAGVGLDPQGLALLEEDLRSPCTEEIAVFRAFAHAVAEGQDGFVVLDTAPTGHTVLLLDAALAYHREVTRQTSQVPEAVKNLLPRLRDPEFTHVLIVTLAEATPVHEAARLQQDLVRAGIQPFAWVINQSLAPLELRDPVLLARRLQEQAYIREVTDDLAKRAVLVPWQVEPPVGVVNLRKIVTGISRATVAAASDRG